MDVSALALDGSLNVSRAGEGDRVVTAPLTREWARGVRPEPSGAPPFL